MDQQGTTVPPAVWEPPVEDAGPAPGVVFAPHGERLVAYILDTIILAVVALAILLLAALLRNLAGGALSMLGFLVMAVVILGYFPYFWKKRGQTPGMKPFQLVVVRDRDGLAITTGQAILRMIGLFVIDGLVFYLGFIWVFIDKRRRAWHDLIAGTVVIKQAR